jgi:hypothetical protein
MITRRGFLAGIIAAGVAPAYVRRGSLGILVPRKPNYVIYEWVPYVGAEFTVPLNHETALRYALFVSAASAFLRDQFAELPHQPLG